MQTHPPTISEIPTRPAPEPGVSPSTLQNPEADHRGWDKRKRLPKSAVKSDSIHKTAHRRHRHRQHHPHTKVSVATRQPYANMGSGGWPRTSHNMTFPLADPGQSRWHAAWDFGTAILHLPPEHNPLWKTRVAASGAPGNLEAHSATGSCEGCQRRLFRRCRFTDVGSPAADDDPSTRIGLVNTSR